MEKLKKQWDQETFQNSFHGFMVVDADSGKKIFNSNGDRYFTPASNVKIATLWAGITMIPDYFPALKYSEVKDSIFVMPTGDPSWLHPYFMDSTAVNFLKGKDKIFLNLDYSTAERFGPGWAWEDYTYYFSPERSPLPLYGNVVTISNTTQLGVFPSFFTKMTQIQDASKNREELFNQFYIGPKEQDTLEVPFIVDKTLTKQLLTSVLEKEVQLIDSFPIPPTKVLQGIKSDSVYKHMMHESDNFLAEQILMTASSTLSDTLGVKEVIDYVLENNLADLRQQPRWVDGSGLSRYNLFTPESMIQILQKLQKNVKQERLFAIFPSWDASGTLSKLDNPDSEPFIFAKSGSLGNNYNLSGYLKTKSGKLLLFSFMNNHFRVPTSEIRLRIYEALKSLQETY